VTAWLEWWRRELQAEVNEAKCGKRRACLSDVEKGRAQAASELERLGPRTRRLLESGVVPLGGAIIDLGYDAARGLEPRVSVDLAFPLVESPALRR
jgi:hypothetical protein